MTTKDEWNEAQLEAALAALGTHDMRADRAERIRTRAVRSLAANASRREWAEAAWRRVEPIAVLAAGLAYMSVVLRIAMSLYG